MSATSTVLKFAAGVVFVAFAVRLAWEVLAPALLPVSVIALVATVLFVAYQRR